jgi:hypothetical protein
VDFQIDPTPFLAKFGGAAAIQDGRRTGKRIMGLLPILQIEVVCAKIGETVGDIRMRLAECTQPDVERLFQQRFGIPGPSGAVHDDGQIVETVGDQRVGIAKRGFAYRKRSARQRLRLRVTLVVANQVTRLSRATSR